MAKVLSVGQCSADHGTITRTLRRDHGAEVDPADDAAEALAQLRAGSYQLVLVNRILDADGTSGLDLIRAIKADSELSTLPVMLVSNFPEAQREAEASGALPGFGKASIHTPSTRERIKAALTP